MIVDHLRICVEEQEPKKEKGWAARISALYYFSHDVRMMQPDICRILAILGHFLPSFFRYKSKSVPKLPFLGVRKWWDTIAATPLFFFWFLL